MLQETLAVLHERQKEIQEEKQGKKQDAADIYYNIAKAASEAKDSDGKPLPMTQTARDAKDKLQTLDPDRAKTIEEPKPENPFGG